MNKRNLKMFNTFILITSLCPAYSFTRQSNTNISLPFYKCKWSKREKDIEVERGEKAKHENHSLVVQMATKLPAMQETLVRLGRSPGGGHGNPLQHSCLENSHGQRSLVGL